MANGLRRIVLLLGFWSLPVFGQPAVPLLQPPLQQITPDGYRARLESLRNLVSACRAEAKACDPSAVGDDNRVQSPNESFQIRWQWLRTLIDDARNPTLTGRNTVLDQASARLDEELAATSGETPPQAAFAPARRAANSILARPEFSIVNGESWLDRQMGRLLSWLYRFFTAASEFGRRSPWVTPVLEWSFVGFSVVCVLIWVVRTMERQRIAISLSNMMPAADWQKESSEWADLARVEAEAGNWREAIHCLYWASIVVLESQRLWRRDSTRTPREYVALLERNSSQQVTLRALTGIFERIWYGLRHAAHEDYVQALALFEALRHS